MNWEKVIEKPIPLFRAEITTLYQEFKSIRQEDIKKTSALFRAKIEADLKKLKEKHG